MKSRIEQSYSSCTYLQCYRTETVSWRFVAIFSHSICLFQLRYWVNQQILAWDSSSNIPNKNIATKFIELKNCSTTAGIAPTVVCSDHCYYRFISTAMSPQEHLPVNWMYSLKCEGTKPPVTSRYLANCLQTPKYDSTFIYRNGEIQYLYIYIFRYI